MNFLFLALFTNGPSYWFFCFISLPPSFCLSVVKTVNSRRPGGKFAWFSIVFVQMLICNPMDCSKPGFSVHDKLPELTQTHVHWVNDAIQPSHPLSSPSLPALNLSQNQGLFQWVGVPSIPASTSASVLPMNIQGRFPLGLTVWSSCRFSIVPAIVTNANCGMSQLFKAPKLELA